MYLIIGLHKHAVIERKAGMKKLSSNDFMALELVFNDPRLSIFTMLKGTVHFEVASKAGEQTPIFFVSEPSRLKLDFLSLSGYKITI